MVLWEDLLLPFDYLPEPEADRYDSALTGLEEYEAALGGSLVEHRAVLIELCD